MPITESDIKLLKSARMTDTPNGGGRMTGNVVQSGVDNNIFDDVSNLDRVHGNSSLRKLFPAVLTNDTDKYLGARVIIDEGPADANIECTLFSASSLFDTRDAAKARLEAYLAAGAPYQGLLYGPHIVGMRTVVLIQQEDREIPGIGDTLMLRKSALGVITEQYVRVTAVTAEIFRFTDDRGDFTRKVVNCTVGDPLRYDFEGWEAQRIDTSLDYGARARVYTTIVADAAQYYGIRPLASPAVLGTYNIKADSSFASLVPSAQVETPLLDLGAAGNNLGYVNTGTQVTFTRHTTFTPTVSLSLGAGVLPGSLSMTMPTTASPVVDNGVGVLTVAGVEFGAIDYANGIATMSNATYALTVGSIGVSYLFGAPVSMALQSDYIPVTVEGRSLTYVASLPSRPAPSTLTISYLVSGKWYVIRDQGNGVVRGAVGQGAGSVNYTTRSVSVTLGALPDVGSHIILQWGLPETVTTLTPLGTLTPVTNLLFEAGFDAGQYTANMTASWNDGAAKSITWSDTTGLTGSGATFTRYAGMTGLTFDTLPPKGTVVTLSGNNRTTTTGTHSAASSASMALPANLVRGSVTLSLTITQVFAVTDHDGFRVYLFNAVPGATTAFSNNNRTVTVTYQVQLRDDGAGQFNIVGGQTPYAKDWLKLGTVNYTTGAVTFVTTPITHAPTLAGPDVMGYKTSGSSGNLHLPWTAFDGGRTATTAVAAQATSVQYSTGTLTAFSRTAAVDAVTIPMRAAPADSTIESVSFNSAGNTYLRDPSNATQLLRAQGSGSVSAVVGTCDASRITLTTWAAGATTAVTDFAAVAAKTTAASGNVFVAPAIVFRTPVAPLRPGSFTVQGRLVQYAGGTPTAFTVTADANGVINTSTLAGYVDYNTGVCHLFAKASGADALAIPAIPRPAWLDQFVSALYPTEWTPGLIVTASVSYNAVAYSYLPLDATVLGLDPVRLPSDGRVPIFKAGRVVVVHNTIKRAPATVSNGQTVDCGRTLLSRIRVFGADGLEITSGFSKNLDAGTITFTNVAGYSQPVVVEHRIEDEALCADAQITGDLRLSRPLTHAYPADTSYVSSAYIAGTLQAAVQDSFSQEAWTNAWADTRIGNPVLAQYNDTAHPIEVTNAGAITERWALIFTSNTTFIVVGEEVGQIITGSTAAPLGPINPATGVPYFTLQPAGWGAGWVAGNVLRFNTTGANFPLWVARTVRQSPTAPPGTDQMTISIRGDIDQ